MAILIQYKNRTYGIVPREELDALIVSKKIVGFRRFSGWVDLIRGPLRGQGSQQRYNGPERRTATTDIFSL